MTTQNPQITTSEPKAKPQIDLSRMSALALVRMCDRTLEESQKALDDARAQLNALAELFGFVRKDNPEQM